MGIIIPEFLEECEATVYLARSEQVPYLIVCIKGADPRTMMFHAPSGSWKEIVSVRKNLPPIEALEYAKASLAQKR